jgi:hypothetical protein
VKFRSNLTRIVQFTAASAGPRDEEAAEEDIETIILDRLQ